MKKIILALSFLLISGVSFADWDVTTPLGSDPKSQGDDRIREIKVDVTAALTKEGTFPGLDTADPRFYWHPSTGTTGERPTGSTEAVNGRVFINTSSNTFEIYNGSTWDAYELVEDAAITADQINTSIAGDGILGGSGEALRLGYNDTQFTVTGDSLTFSEPLVLTGSITAAGGVFSDTITTTGYVLASSQPAFLVYNDVNDADVTGDVGTIYQVLFDTKIYDKNENFDLTASSFTAPVDGKYLFNIMVSYRANTSHAASLLNFKFITSNRTYFQESVIPGSITIGGFSHLNIITDMEAGDIAYATLEVGGAVDDVDVRGNGSSTIFTYWSGELLP